MEQGRLTSVKISFYVLAIGFFLSACHHNTYTPKPRGYYRIDFPVKKYLRYSAGCPFSFEYPVYARVIQDSSAGTEPCWLNIDYPAFQGRVHLSYKPVTSGHMLRQLAEDARDFAYKHSVKATSIEEIPISIPARHVYGVYYQIEGNTASSAQFYLTDSVHHYLRAALYFNVEPRIDSIRPVLNFVKADLNRMIQSFNWKN